MSKPTPVNRYSGQVFEFLTVLDTPVTVVPMLFSHALSEIGVKKAAGNNFRVRHGLTHQEVLNHYAGVQ